METISISKLKAHLSSEIKKVRSGARLIVLDHNHPVAELVPLEDQDGLFSRAAEGSYEYRELAPLVEGDITDFLADERKERW